MRMHITLRRAVLAVAVAVAQTDVACAATLRTATTLQTPTVRLADLFDGLGPQADRVLGPGPQPGSRIVVEAAQLALIARQFGVDWRPASGNDRAVIERLGRILPREAIVEPLREALTSAGGPADGTLDTPGLRLPTVSVTAHPDVIVEQLDYSADSGRFSAILLVTGEDIDPQRLAVSGELSAMVQVLVSTRRLNAGDVITPDDLRPMRVRAARVHGEVLRTPDQATGLVLRRAAFPGQPIQLADVARPNDVRKGARVMIELDTNGISIAVQGIAMSSGAIGERISVQNPSSRAVVEADIVGYERVRVAPGSSPILPAQEQAPRIAGR